MIKKFNDYINENLKDKENIKNLSFEEKLDIAIKEDVVQLMQEIISEDNSIINDSLVRAAAFNSLKVIEYLLDNGADIHYQEDAALRWACRESNYESVKLLLEKGADPTAKNHGAYEYAEWGEDQEMNLKIIDLLDEYI